MKENVTGGPAADPTEEAHYPTQKLRFMEDSQPLTTARRVGARPCGPPARPGPPAVSPAGPVWPCTRGKGDAPPAPGPASWGLFSLPGRGVPGADGLGRRPGSGRAPSVSAFCDFPSPRPRVEPAPPAQPAFRRHPRAGGPLAAWSLGPRGSRPLGSCRAKSSPQQECHSRVLPAGTQMADGGRGVCPEAEVLGGNLQREPWGFSSLSLLCANGVTH